MPIIEKQHLNNDLNINKRALYVLTVLTLLFVIPAKSAYAQPCDLITPTFIVDLTGTPDSVWQSPSISRDGY